MNPDNWTYYVFFLTPERLSYWIFELVWSKMPWCSWLWSITLNSTLFINTETLDMQVLEVGKARDKDQRITWFLLKIGWGAPGWLSVKHLTSAQVVISGAWDRAPVRDFPSLSGASACLFPLAPPHPQTNKFLKINRLKGTKEPTEESPNCGRRNTCSNTVK